MNIVIASGGIALQQSTERGVILRPLANGFSFSRSACWFEGLVWFSDQSGEAVHTVNMAGAMTTLPLPGCAPSGLAFRADGSLLIVSTESRQIMRYDGDTVGILHDLSNLAPAALDHMVIDAMGRMYIGSRTREDGVIVKIDTDGTPTVAATHLELPSGMAVTPDGQTLLVAESTARRLTAFTIGAHGVLSDRRLFADDLDGPPDGIALDTCGGIWTSTTVAHQFQRITEGGNVTDRIDVGDRKADACTFGGATGRTLFLFSSTEAIGTKLSRLDTVTVDIPGAGPPHFVGRPRIR